MRNWLGAYMLALLAAGPVQAETFDCEHGEYVYHQSVPCDDPDGHVYQLRQEAQEEAHEKRTEVIRNRLAQEWRAVFSDSDVYMVQGMAEAYLQNRMRDPDSFDVVTRHAVLKNDYGYKVDLTYRARNGFGGMTIETATVFLDKSMNGRNVIVHD